MTRDSSSSSFNWPVHFNFDYSRQRKNCELIKPFGSLIWHPIDRNYGRHRLIVNILLTVLKYICNHFRVINEIRIWSLYGVVLKELRYMLCSLHPYSGICMYNMDSRFNSQRLRKHLSILFRRYIDRKRRRKRTSSLLIKYVLSAYSCFFLYK
jgi:hypothetical protein